MNLFISGPFCAQISFDLHLGTIYTEFLHAHHHIHCALCYTTIIITLARLHPSNLEKNKKPYIPDLWTTFTFNIRHCSWPN